jgi:predicted molibdopterin-dependent oxidoreductase YjgC
MSAGSLSRENLPARVLANAATSDRSEALVHFSFNGTALSAVAGTSVAAALWAAGQRALRITHSGEPRGIFCGMGVCFDCLVEIDGRPNVRACRVAVAEGMRVRTQQGAGSREEAP